MNVQKFIQETKEKVNILKKAKKGHVIFEF